MCVVGGKRKGEGEGVLLWEGKKLPEIEPKACALTWGISPESARKALSETPDSHQMECMLSQPPPLPRRRVWSRKNKAASGSVESGAHVLARLLGGRKLGVLEKPLCGSVSWGSRGTAVMVPHGVRTGKGSRH